MKKKNLQESSSFYDEKVSERVLEERLQGEIRTCLRTIVHDIRGQTTTAAGLLELFKVRYPGLYNKNSNIITLKSISEYLKAMHLKTSRITTTLYTCEKQFHDM